MRISDDDRQRAVDELRAHLVDGRIDLDAFTARVEEVLAAETLADVDRARRDLPHLRIQLPPGRPRPVLAPGRPAGRPGAAWRARLVLALAALLVVSGVVVALVAQAVWVVLLVVGWAIGLLQGRASAGRR